jgi:2OG-Fe(II) oxygenase superfamily/GRF zinc finger
MDAFVSRKRKRVASPGPRDRSPKLEKKTAVGTPDEEYSTDVKLAILTSLNPSKSQEDLLDLLINCNGSVGEATTILTSGPVATLSPRKKSGSIGLQSSLTFTHSGDKSPSKAVKPLTRKGKTVHLFTPADIAAHTPCSIIHNFLPAEESTSLLKELLPETPTFHRATFKLFDNVVRSPHSAGFYVNSLEERDKQTSEYLYNGNYLSDVREILPEMRNVSAKVQEAVNKEIAIRIRDHYPDGKKLKHQCPDEWFPNAAFVNCYDGGAESVGWHSDQLTYIGTRPIIGTLSLGVAREFRVRKIVVREEEDGGENAGLTKSKESSERSRGDDEGQIAIHLPHNSLLVMHAEMQEEWKHSIHPAVTIEPHPIAGNKRISITYRWYRECFHPRYTPKCRCGLPTVLKCVQKKKENRGRYMWMCQAGNIPGKQSCGFFEWGEFTDDGEPVWKQQQQRQPQQ